MEWLKRRGSREGGGAGVPAAERPAGAGPRAGRPDPHDPRPRSEYLSWDDYFMGKAPDLPTCAPNAPRLAPRLAPHMNTLPARLSGPAVLPG